MLLDPSISLIKTNGTEAGPAPYLDEVWKEVRAE